MLTCIYENHATFLDTSFLIHNLTEEKKMNMLELIGTGKDFLNRTLVVQALKQIIDK